MPVVTLNQVSKLYGRFAALREVSAEFEPGRLYAIFGENGAGKSTLLRVIAGLARPSSGTVRYGDTVTNGQERAAILRKLGYMAHAAMLYDELTALENLRYFGALYGMTRSDDAKLRAAIAAVGLDAGLDRHVGEYSQGMRQRLSLARTILHEPQLLLLDEPFSNLDANSSQEIGRLLASWRDAGRTILVVTHQAAQVEPIADASLWLERGAIARRTSAQSSTPPGARA
ncbi:MAG: heme ABC exporter ATP-binding protein CcmA [Candidatus Acidiferrum sp.]